MEQEKVIVRQDVNFIEYPIWAVDRQSRQFVYKIKDNKGEYIFKAQPDNIPNDTDVLILYYFLYTLQEKGEAALNKLSTYRVLKDLGLSTCKRNYERFDKAVEKWHEASVKFTGNFYYKETIKDKYGNEEIITGRTKKYFHFLSIKINEEYKNDKFNNSKYNIKIDDDFLSSIKNSGFIKYIDLKRYIALKTPIARRLDEWLPKQFIKKDRNIYKINHISLFLKLRITIPKYFSDIERKLKTIEKGLEKINKLDDEYNYSIEYEKKENTRNIFYIKIDKNNKETTVKPDKLFLITFKQDKKQKLLSNEKISKQVLFKNEFFKKLQEYFKQSDEQAEWILKNIKEDDLKIAFDILEDRYKKGKIKNLGAYTWGYFKKGQYKSDIETQQKEIELKEKKAKQKKEELKKQLEKDIQRNYQIHINQCVDNFEENLSKKEKKLFKENAEKQADDKYPNTDIRLRASFAKLGYRILINKEMEKQNLIIPFEDWRKKEMKKYNIS